MVSHRQVLLAASALVVAGCSDGMVSPLETGPSLHHGITVDITHAPYNAVPGDNVDDSGAITLALQNADHVYIPAGTFKVNQQISVPAGKYIYGSGPGSILDATGLPPEHDPNLSVAVFLVENQGENPNGIQIDHLKFVGNSNGGNHWALRVVNTANVTFRDNTANQMGMVSVSNGARRVRVIRNEATGPAGHYGAINVSFADSVRVDSNTVNNHRGGITWWGGDAALEPGPNVHTKGVTRVQIHNNTVENIFFAGSGEGPCIWGSMGEYIDVRYNTVRYCDDVGLDAEGSRHVNFADNRVYHVKNEALALFWYSTDVTFARNYVEQNGWGTGDEGTTFWGSVHTHMGPIGINNIYVHDNVFVYRPATSSDPRIGRVAKRPSEHLVFANNQLTNVAIDFRGCWSWTGGGYCGSNGYMEVTGNRLNFESGTGDFGQPGIWIEHANSQTWTNDNHVIAAASQSGAGIKLSPNQPTGHFAQYNQISGFATSLDINGTGGFFVDHNTGSGQFKCNGASLWSNVGNSWGSVQPGC